MLLFQHCQYFVVSSGCRCIAEIMLGFYIALSLLLVVSEVSARQVAVQGCPASRLQSTLGEVDLSKPVLIICVSWKLRFVYWCTLIC